MKYEDISFAVNKLLNDAAASEDAKRVAGHVGALVGLTRQLQERVDRMEKNFEQQIRNLSERM